ncbi:MAG TPA: hypothetical protein PK069_10510 [Methanolinea sp.]|nr:hypothetical protein [Methanolinea sp.]HQJ39039.1 hypothetical protein [Methanoregulaceae archaeon]
MVHSRQVLSIGKTVRLKPTFPRVETVPVHPRSTTRFRDIPRRFGQLQDRQAVTSDCLIRVFRRDTSHTDHPS